MKGNFFTFRCLLVAIRHVLTHKREQLEAPPKFLSIPSTIHPLSPLHTPYLSKIPLHLILPYPFKFCSPHPHLIHSLTLRISLPLSSSSLPPFSLSFTRKQLPPIFSLFSSSLPPFPLSLSLPLTPPLLPSPMLLHYRCHWQIVASRYILLFFLCFFFQRPCSALQVWTKGLLFGPVDPNRGLSFRPVGLNMRPYVWIPKSEQGLKKNLKKIKKWNVYTYMAEQCLGKK